MIFGSVGARRQMSSSALPDAGVPRLAARRVDQGNAREKPIRWIEIVKRKGTCGDAYFELKDGEHAGLSWSCVQGLGGEDQHVHQPPVPRLRPARLQSARTEYRRGP